MPFNSKKYKKRFSKDEASALAEKFCAYQERCHQEVRTRLYEYGISSEEVEEVLMDLIQHGFLNEERFARSYARGKFRTKKWGRVKIIKELKSRDISPYCIKKGMEEISNDAYDQTLNDLAEAYSLKTKESNSFKKRGKVAAYLIRKGYETDLVWEWVKEFVY